MSHSWKVDQQRSRNLPPSFTITNICFVHSGSVCLMKTIIEKKIMLFQSLAVLLSVVAVAATSAEWKDESRDLKGNPPTNGVTPCGAKCFSFFFWGDWGKNIPTGDPGNSDGINYEEENVAAQVTSFSKILNPSFYVLLGDNFYDKGVKSTTDPLWNAYYTSIYSDPATQVPWYPVFGNHDYYGLHNPQPEIDFYKEGRDNRWTFPDYQYTRTWRVPGTGKTLQIFFINTVTLCPESEYGTNDDKIPWPPNPTKKFPNPDPKASIQDHFIADPTLNWIDRALNASTADWKIVAGHYHAYTNTDGDQNKPEGLCLQNRLVPLMKKYGVAAYMHGHEHNFEHFVIDGISYITVGHGCSEDDALAAGTPAGLLYNKTIGGFAHMQVRANKLHFDYIDEYSNLLYSYDITGNRRSLRGE